MPDEYPDRCSESLERRILLQEGEESGGRELAQPLENFYLEDAGEGETLYRIGQFDRGVELLGGELLRGTFYLTCYLVVDGFTVGNGEKCYPP